MRIDKYLKLSRVIKRRTIAKDILSLGFVKINAKIAKPSTEVKEGDIVELTLGERILTIKVCNVLTYANKQTSSTMFEVIKDESI